MAIMNLPDIQLIKEPKLDSYIGELWDNIEIGKLYVIEIRENIIHKVEITEISNEKRAVQYLYYFNDNTKSKDHDWMTSKRFINCLIDEVQKC